MSSRAGADDAENRLGGYSASPAPLARRLDPVLQGGVVGDDERAAASLTMPQMCSAGIGAPATPARKYRNRYLAHTPIAYGARRSR